MSLAIVGTVAGGFLGAGTAVGVLGGAALGGLAGGLLGGGGADAPDTSGVNAAAVANAQVSKEALDFYKAEMARTQGQRDAASDTSQQAARAAIEALNKNTALADEYAAYNRDTFRPLEKGIIADAQAYDTPERRMQAIAQSQADVQRNVALNRDASMRSSRRMGVTPSSGRALASQTALDLGAAKLGAGASQQAVQNIEQQGYARRMDAASLGRNLPSNQATSQQIATQAGNSASNNATAALQAAQSGAALMGQGFNTAIQGNQSAGNLYGQAAQIQGQSGGADLAGIAQLGLAGAKLWPLISSDKKAKKNARRMKPEQSLEAIEKTPVASWDYKAGEGDGGSHVGPMAQHVKKHMGEETAPGGKAIDMISMQGHLLGAVQELSKRVGRMERTKA